MVFVCLSDEAFSAAGGLVVSCRCCYCLTLITCFFIFNFVSLQIGGVSLLWFPAILVKLILVAVIIIVCCVMCYEWC